ncbi:MAG: hypothetical protein AAFV72_00195 [Cyanobacteria bacterium J06635_1]
MIAQIDLTEESEVDFSRDFNADEVWTIGDLSLTVSDDVSEALAKHLLFSWLTVADKLPKDMTSDQFWHWLGVAAEEKLLKDGGYTKITPQTVPVAPLFS